jgi:uncharacterized small protein (DUF1192 family)
MTDRLAAIKAAGFINCDTEDFDWLISEVERLKAHAKDENKYVQELLATIERLKAELHRKNHTRLDQLESDTLANDVRIKALVEEVADLARLRSAVEHVEADLLGNADSRQRGNMTLIETCRLDSLFAALRGEKQDG